MFLKCLWVKSQLCWESLSRYIKMVWLPEDSTCRTTVYKIHHFWHAITTSYTGSSWWFMPMNTSKQKFENMNSPWKKNLITQKWKKQIDSLGQKSFAYNDIICILLWRVPANLQPVVHKKKRVSVDYLFTSPWQVLGRYKCWQWDIWSPVVLTHTPI